MMVGLFLWYRILDDVSVFVVKIPYVVMESSFEKCYNGYYEK